jgi:hypothetical protein
MQNSKGVKLLVLEKKNEYEIQINKKFELNLKRVSGPSLHKNAPDIYIIIISYHHIYMCGHIVYYGHIVYQQRNKKRI